MKICCISDTHNDFYLLDLKPSDVLIFAGDIDAWNQASFWHFNRWLKKQPFKYKIVCAGNHDRYLSECGYKSIQKQLTNGIYLENSSVEIEGVKFYGSPMTPTFMDWYFMSERDEIHKYWDLISKDVDVLITHGPPHGILDYVPNTYQIDHHVGCEALLKKVEEIKPKFHVFGHIHYSFGIFKNEHTTFVNAALLNEGYALTNKPVTIEI